MIYILRHGECDLNAEQRFRCQNWRGDLTDLGREQARKAGQWLRDKNVVQIRYSPFDRTQQTADIIGEILDLIPNVDHDLSEVNCGTELEERTYKEGMDAFLAVFLRWIAGDFDAQFPGGETFRTAFDRFARALRQIDPKENTMLVTHGGITRAVIPPLCVNAAALQQTRILDNAGFALLEWYDAGRFYCEAWNLVEHLG